MMKLPTFIHCLSVQLRFYILIFDTLHQIDLVWLDKMDALQVKGIMSIDNDGVYTSVVERQLLLVLCVPGRTAAARIICFVRFFWCPQNPAPACLIRQSSSVY
jgi:hypothetical protein